MCKEYLEGFLQFMSGESLFFRAVSLLQSRYIFLVGAVVEAHK